MFKFSVLLALLAAISSIGAYEFEDSAFNEVLMSDFQQLHEETFGEEISRRKRSISSEEDENSSRPQDQTKRNHPLENSKCCNDDDNDFEQHKKQFKQFHDLKRQCFVELFGNASHNHFHLDVFNCEQMQALKEGITCMSQCVAQKLGLADAHGNIRKKKLSSHLKSNLGDIDWKQESADKIIGKCMSKIRDEDDDDDDDDNDDSSSINNDDNNSSAARGSVARCNTQPLKVTHCIFRQFALSCPKNLQVNSSRCNAMRKGMKEEKQDAFNAAFRHITNRHHHRRPSHHHRHHGQED